MKKSKSTKLAKSASRAMDVPTQTGIDKRAHDHFRSVRAGDINVPVNSRPLSAFIQAGHVRERVKGYDKKYRPIMGQASVVKAAARSQMKLKHVAITDTRPESVARGGYARGAAYPDYGGYGSCAPMSSSRMVGGDDDE